MKKKALLLTLSAAALVAASAFGTMAYLTDKDTDVNTFTVGHVDITLDEADVKPDGTYETDENSRVTSNEYHLLPGHEYIKDPTVTIKTPSEDCYVRMLVTINKSKEWDAICESYKDSEGNNKFGAEDMLVNLSSDWVLKENTKNTTANTRTYEFWYKEKVKQNKTEDTELPALFEAIKVPGELTNADMEKLGDDFKIEVVAHAIQADGFDTAEDAWEMFDPNLPGYDFDK